MPPSMPSKMARHHAARRHRPPVAVYDDSTAEIQGSLPPLPRQREVELARAYRETGDAAALDLLVRSNVRFVLSIARQYEGRGLALSEIYSAGCVGLMTGINRFDERRGFKLITYAVNWIRQGIMEALRREVRCVRVPVNVASDRHAIARCRRDMERRSGAEVSMSAAAEEAARVGLVSPGAAERHHLGGVEYSLDAPVDACDNDKRTIGDLLSEGIEEEDVWDCEEMRQALHALVGTLTGRPLLVVQRYYGLGGQAPLTLEQIGDEIGLTRERIRQILNKTLGILRDRLLHGSAPGAVKIVELLEAA